MRDLSQRKEELEKQRMLSILNLGEITYSKLRGGEAKDPQEISYKISQIDKELYEIEKKIISIEIERKGLKCSKCREEISITDKFCNNCGETVNAKEDREILGNCKVCKNTLYLEDKFCSACGYSI